MLVLLRFQRRLIIWFFFQFKNISLATYNYITGYITGWRYTSLYYHCILVYTATRHGKNQLHVDLIQAPIWLSCIKRLISSKFCVYLQIKIKAIYWMFKNIILDIYFRYLFIFYSKCIKQKFQKITIVCYIKMFFTNNVICKIFRTIFSFPSIVWFIKFVIHPHAVASSWFPLFPFRNGKSN